MTNLERELRRSQPRWGYIEIWLRKHGWSPEDNYAVLLPESFPLGSDRGKPYWVVLWCPVEHLRVERSIFPYPLMPESWSKPHWPAI